MYVGVNVAVHVRAVKRPSHLLNCAALHVLQSVLQCVAVRVEVYVAVHAAVFVAVCAAVCYSVQAQSEGRVTS